MATTADRRSTTSGPLRVCTFLACAMLLLAAACTPTVPGASGAQWRPTVSGFSGAGASSVDVTMVATSTQWYVQVQSVGGLGTAEPIDTVQFFPRSSSGGSPAATPSQEFVLPGRAAVLVAAPHTAAVHVRSSDGAEAVHLFGLDEHGAGWVESAPMPLTVDAPGQRTALDVTDDALFIGISHPSVGDGVVVIRPLALSSGGHTWSAAPMTQLGPDLAWSSSERAGFGRVVSAEGDWLAVASANDHVGVYRRVASVWALDVTLDNPVAPGSDGRFARSMSVDVDPATSQIRLLVGSQGGFVFGSPTAGRADLFHRGPAGWSIEHTWTPPVGAPLNGLVYGIAVALDGHTAVVGYDWVQLPSNDGERLVNDQRLQVWDLSAPPTLEATLSTLATLGQGDTVQASLGMSPSVDGDHLVAVGWQTFDGSLNRYAAISYDRY